ncbi:MAG: lysophospholipid acyltransferase family protein [Acidobacteria bacterium]|nr:lysophospholipid acyltransferase family protein [Acidobacteriota bacterium]
MSRQAPLSHRLMGSIGELVGSLFFVGGASRRRITRRNLSLAFPERTAHALEPIARRSFRHFGAAILESFSLARLSAETICRLLSFENWQHFAEAESENRGVIVLSAHLGVQEVISSVVSLYRGPMHVIARPFSNAAIDRKVRAMRERFGNHLLPKRHAARGMLRALDQGGRVAILIDQRVHPLQGVQVPFFGRPSWTSPLPAQISLRSGAPVLPLFAYRLPGGRYRIVTHAPIHPTRPTGSGRSKPSDSEVAALTARYTEVTELAIRRELDQWLWMHDRWRRH